MWPHPATHQKRKYFYSQKAPEQLKPWTSSIKLKYLNLNIRKYLIKVFPDHGALTVSVQRVTAVSQIFRINFCPGARGGWWDTPREPRGDTVCQISPLNIQTVNMPVKSIKNHWVDRHFFDTVASYIYMSVRYSKFRWQV